MPDWGLKAPGRFHVPCPDADEPRETPVLHDGDAAGEEGVSGSRPRRESCVCAPTSSRAFGPASERSRPRLRGGLNL
jgi:hypothetical protein